MNGLDLVVFFVGTITFAYLIKTLVKLYRRTSKINKLVDRYNRIDRQFAAKRMFDECDIYGDSLNYFKSKKG